MVWIGLIRFNGWNNPFESQAVLLIQHGCVGISVCPNGIRLRTEGKLDEGTRSRRDPDGIRKPDRMDPVRTRGWHTFVNMLE